VPRPLLAELTRSRKRANLTDLTSIALQVAIRAHQDGLLLQRLYFADEVHNAAEIDRGADTKLRDQERPLTERLISELSATEFQPENYEDEYRKRPQGDRAEGRGAGHPARRG
jgi:non-homologous end joining protein Ku